MKEGKEDKRPRCANCGEVIDWVRSTKTVFCGRCEVIIEHKKI